MADYILATASTADLPLSWLREHNIPFISYTYTIGNELFEDDCTEEARAEVYKRMRAGEKLKTSQINEYAYYDFFKSLLDTGKDVIFVDMTKKISASYGRSLDALEMVRPEYPDRRIEVMDTRCVSGGLGLLVKLMTAQMEAGKSYQEVLDYGESIKLQVSHRFTVDDLKWLKEGGRCSNAAALVGTMLSIKPVLYVPDEGTLVAEKKMRGRKLALKAISEGIISDLALQDSIADRTLDILHADCKEDAETVAAAVREAYPDLGEISITSLGVVIGAHTGPGLIACFYLGGRRP